MKDYEILKAAEDGFDTEQLQVEETGETGEEILGTEFDKHFDEFVKDDDVEFREESFKSRKVCLKTTVAAITHPFQTKMEWDWIIVKIPFNGTVKEKGRPRLYRRSVKYVVYAEVCYPVALMLQHVERCAKQGAIAAKAAVLTGNIPAAKVAFQTAFLACMALADAQKASQISIRLHGDKIHGKWIPV